jgi:hypothetical protein
MSNHDHNHYVDWRNTRINKLEQVYGKGYFYNLNVLEVGAGSGSIGKFLREEWGAKVTFTEGRPELAQRIKNNNPGAEVYQIDHDKEWELGKRFKIIIHWGLLYNLDNWKQDLTSAVRHLDLGGQLCLESEIMDHPDDIEIKREEPTSHDDQSLNGLGTQPTATAVEKHLRKLNLDFKRYDDTDLNSGFHHYDWVSVGGKKCGSGQRRFWIAW